MIKEARIDTMTHVILQFADNPNDGGKYELLCVAHDYLLQDNNKRRLWQFANEFEMANWCQGCAGMDPRFDNYDDTLGA